MAIRHLSSSINFKQSTLNVEKVVKELNKPITKKCSNWPLKCWTYNPSRQDPTTFTMSVGR